MQTEYLDIHVTGSDISGDYHQQPQRSWWRLHFAGGSTIAESIDHVATQLLSLVNATILLQASKSCPIFKTDVHTDGAAQYSGKYNWH